MEQPNIPAGDKLPGWVEKWKNEWLLKMECQGVDPKVRAGFAIEIDWLYQKINDTPPPAGPVWVKCNDRMPTKAGDYVLRHTSGDMVIGRFGRALLFFTSDNLSINKDYYEWLDDQPSPRAAADREKERAIAFANWCIDNMDKLSGDDEKDYDLFRQSNP